jgi:hypothetical protein
MQKMRCLKGQDSASSEELEHRLALSKEETTLLPRRVLSNDRKFKLGKKAAQSAVQTVPDLLLRPSHKRKAHLRTASNNDLARPGPPARKGKHKYTLSNEALPQKKRTRREY